MSDEIDGLIVRYLSDDSIDPREMIGVLAHRAGTLLRHLEHKNEVWEVCEKLLKKQAIIE